MTDSGAVESFLRIIIDEIYQIHSCDSEKEADLLSLSKTSQRLDASIFCQEIYSRIDKIIDDEVNWENFITNKRCAEELKNKLLSSQKFQFLCEQLRQVIESVNPIAQDFAHSENEVLCRPNKKLFRTNEIDSQDDKFVSIFSRGTALDNFFSYNDSLPGDLWMGRIGNGENIIEKLESGLTSEDSKVLTSALLALKEVNPADLQYSIDWTNLVGLLRKVLDCKDINVQLIGFEVHWIFFQKSFGMNAADIFESVSSKICKDFGLLSKEDEPDLCNILLVQYQQDKSLGRLYFEKNSRLQLMAKKMKIAYGMLLKMNQHLVSLSGTQSEKIVTQILKLFTHYFVTDECGLQEFFIESSNEYTNGIVLTAAHFLGLLDPRAECLTAWIRTASVGVLCNVVGHAVDIAEHNGRIRFKQSIETKEFQKYSVVILYLCSESSDSTGPSFTLSQLDDSLCILSISIMSQALCFLRGGSVHLDRVVQILADLLVQHCENVGSQRHLFFTEICASNLISIFEASTNLKNIGILALFSKLAHIYEVAKKGNSVHRKAFFAISHLVRIVLRSNESKLLLYSIKPDDCCPENSINFWEPTLILKHLLEHVEENAQFLQHCEKQQKCQIRLELIVSYMEAVCQLLQMSLEHGISLSTKTLLPFTRNCTLIFKSLEQYPVLYERAGHAFCEHARTITGALSLYNVSDGVLQIVMSIFKREFMDTDTSLEIPHESLLLAVANLVFIQSEASFRNSTNFESKSSLELIYSLALENLKDASKCIDHFEILMEYADQCSNVIPRQIRYACLPLLTLCEPIRGFGSCSENLENMLVNILKFSADISMDYQILSCILEHCICIPGSVIDLCVQLSFQCAESSGRYVEVLNLSVDQILSMWSNVVMQSYCSYGNEDFDTTWLVELSKSLESDGDYELGRYSLYRTDQKLIFNSMLLVVEMQLKNFFPGCLFQKSIEDVMSDIRSIYKAFLGVFTSGSAFCSLLVLYIAAKADCQLTSGALRRILENETILGSTLAYSRTEKQNLGLNSGALRLAILLEHIASVEVPEVLELLNRVGVCMGMLVRAWWGTYFWGIIPLSEAAQCLKLAVKGGVSDQVYLMVCLLQHAKRYLEKNLSLGYSKVQLTVVAGIGGVYADFSLNSYLPQIKSMRTKYNLSCQFLDEKFHEK